MNNEEILNKLKQIPFFDFKSINFDYETIKQEVLRNEMYYDYTPPWIQPTDELKQVHANYTLVSLLIVNPLAKSSIVRQHFAWYKDQTKTDFVHYFDLPIEERKTYTTEIADQFPSLMSFISSITDKPISIQIVKTIGNHGLGWHSHQNDKLIKHYSLPEQCIMHLPILTNNDCIHMVTTDDIENRLNFENLDYYEYNKNYHVERFTVEKLWFFNSYHMHSYKNYSNETRIDVIIYNDILQNNKLYNLLRKELAIYDGVYL